MCWAISQPRAYKRHERTLNHNNIPQYPPKYVSPNKASSLSTTPTVGLKRRHQTDEWHMDDKLSFAAKTTGPERTVLSVQSGKLDARREKER